MKKEEMKPGDRPTCELGCCVTFHQRTNRTNIRNHQVQIQTSNLRHGLN